MSRLALILAALVTLTASLAHAQTVPTALGSGFCGYASAATPLSAQVATGAVYASATVASGTVTTPTIPTLTQGSIVGVVVFVSANAVRERHDGTDPTGNAGMIYGTGTTANLSETPNGQSFIVCGSDLPKLRLTGASTNSAIVYFNYYGAGR